MRADRPLLGTGDAATFVALAEELRASGRPLDALAVLREGFKLHTDLPSGRLVLARVHLDLGEPGLASAVLEELLLVEPEEVGALVMLARIRITQGDRTTARVLYHQASAVTSTDMRVQALREELMPSARRVRDPRDPFTCSWLAERLEERGRTDAARRIWRQLHESHEDEPRVAARLAALSERS